MRFSSTWESLWDEGEIQEQQPFKRVGLLVGRRMVVSQNRGTPIPTPKHYNPYYWDPQNGIPNSGNALDYRFDFLCCKHVEGILEGAKHWIHHFGAGAWSFCGLPCVIESPERCKPLILTHSYFCTCMCVCVYIYAMPMLTSLLRLVSSPPVVSSPPEHR